MKSRSSGTWEDQISQPSDKQQQALETAKQPKIMANVNRNKLLQKRIATWILELFFFLIKIAGFSNLSYQNGPPVSKSPTFLHDIATLSRKPLLLAWLCRAQAVIQLSQK